MKKVILFLVAFGLVSCGGDKSKKESVDAANTEVENKYSVEVEGIYEKPDSLLVCYKIDGYYKYDTPVTQVIKGSPVLQKIVFNIPAGKNIENVTLIASTNKEQSTIMVNNVTVKKNDKVVADGSNYKHSKYFVTDASFSWNEKAQRFNLDHTKENPPALSGTVELESILSE